MKYINHMTCAFRDEKCQAAVADLGLKVYGAYWVLAEEIAAQIRPESISTKLHLTWAQWASRLQVDPRSARNLTRKLHAVGLIVVQDFGKSACIDIPNLLKYADEWTRRVMKSSGGTPETTREKLGSNSGAPALPALQTKKKHMCDSSAAADGAPNSKREKRVRGNVAYPPEFQEFWSAYPRPVAKRVAFQRWQAVLQAGYPDAHLLSAAKEYADRCGKQGTEERFILHPATFLAKDRWKDYVFEDAVGVA